MTTMASRQLPAHLLAPYVAAAARCVLDRDQLDDVSKQAVAEAQLQLAAEESALRGSSARFASESHAALAAATGVTLEFAELALEAKARLDATEQASITPSEEVSRVADELAQMVTQLERMSAGDIDAAAQVADIFGLVVDQIFRRDDLQDLT